MNIKKAHEHLEEAENSIRYFFLPTDNFDVICNLLKLSRNSETLGMAIAYAKVALSASIDGGCDESKVVAGHIHMALGELEYQRQCDATR